MLKKIKSFLFENKTDKQTIMKNTFWLMLAEGVSKGGMFLITILIARLLGPEQFGVLSFVMSFVAMFIVITDFGLTTLMVREVSRDHSKIKDYLINLSFLKVVLGIITFLLVWIVSHFIGKPNFYTTLILIYVGYAIINNFGEFIRAFFRPSEKMQYEALLKIINGVLMLVIVLGALFLYGDLESILWGYLIAGVISSVISLVYVGRKFEVGRLILDKNIIKSSLISGILLFGGLFIIGLLSNTDKIMLGYYGYNYELGLYSAIYNLINILKIIVNLIVIAILPNLIKSYSLKKVNTILKYLSIISIISLILGILFGKNIIGLIYGIEYIKYESYLMLIIFLFMFLFISINIFLFQYLNYKGIEKGTFYFSIICFIINIIGNIILIPIYKGVGASIVTLIIEITMLILILSFYRKKIFYDFKDKTKIKTF